MPATATARYRPNRRGRPLHARWTPPRFDKRPSRSVTSLSTARGGAVRSARRAHNPEVAGSNPAPATTKRPFGAFSHFVGAMGCDGGTTVRSTHVTRSCSLSAAGDVDGVPRRGARNARPRPLASPAEPAGFKRSAGCLAWSRRFVEAVGRRRPLVAWPAARGLFADWADGCRACRGAHRSAQ